ncbi:LysM peptidoglycan-binding domain-containing protein [Hymenobacter sp. BT175]|uniref:CIS tube protein n=1 Tax=Hymenobacter translucens TaxID=2886507 RepID=UPI001D0E18EB|nr:LysM peptidoglycan-binding domain-containing protein [Hymenobacter translucens]MCC2545351.1 LysM peptidoglycan-binding domain-containing protein [Hymenobacter translucens]
MSLVKMTIQAYEDEKFSTKGARYDVFLNPESFSHTHSVTYSKTQKPGAAGGSPKFTHANPDTVSFALHFDGTGVIDSTRTDVAAEIKQLQNVVLDYQGKIHAPYYLKLIWGSFLFNCRLTKFDVSYTMFRPDGSPLRAKVQLGFVGFIDAGTLAKQEDKQSSDLSHRYQVKAGDTLPVLCNRIYGKPDYYLQVARQNNLVHFRRLEPGSYIVFPPLV